MENCVIIIAFHTELDEIASRFWYFFAPQLHINVAVCSDKEHLKSIQHKTCSRSIENKASKNFREPPPYLAGRRRLLDVDVAHSTNVLSVTSQVKKNMGEIRWANVL
jgi:hypothetical protein